MKFIPILAFWSLGIIWGSNFIYMKMAAEFIEPIQVVFFRVLFGFIPVFIYALYLKVLKIEDLRYIVHFVVMSLLAAVIYFFGYVKRLFFIIIRNCRSFKRCYSSFFFFDGSYFFTRRKNN